MLGSGGMEINDPPPCCSEPNEARRVEQMEIDQNVSFVSEESCWRVLRSCGLPGPAPQHGSLAPGLWPHWMSSEQFPGQNSSPWDRQNPKNGRGRGVVTHAGVLLLDSPFGSGSGVRPGL